MMLLICFLSMDESALTLLEARVFLVDDEEHPLAADNLAVNTSFLDGGFDLHDA